MRRYLFYIFLSASLPALCVVTINWIVDPYWIFGGYEIRGLNVAKPRIESNQRIFEINRVRMTAPEILILGTSREDHGIDPNHPALGGGLAFNAAIPLQSYQESLFILQQLVQEHHTPKSVVLGLLFEIANTQLKLPDNFSTTDFQPTQRWELLASLSTFTDAVKTVQTNYAVSPQQPENTIWQKNGHNLHPANHLTNNGEQRVSFTKNENFYLRNMHWPEPVMS